MSLLALLLLGLFLPLFPLSMVFNNVFGRLRHPVLKSLLLFIWPLAGLLIFALSQHYEAFIGLDGLLAQLRDSGGAEMLTAWAALTALLYAFRMLTQRDMHSWIGYLATSAWPLLWLPLLGGTTSTEIASFIISFNVPLIMLVWLAATLKQRFGAAYTHLYNGLAEPMPRYSGVLVLTLLAAIATPLFPAFFVMLKLLLHSTPVAIGLALLSWLLWSWAGIRLLQGLLVGSSKPGTAQAADLPYAYSLLYGCLLVLLLVLGIMLAGEL